MADVEHKVLKYKSYLETNQNGNKVLYIFTRLTEMLITIDILQRTGIGKVVNSFRKKEGEIGQLAKDIVARWRSMVAEEALRIEAEAEARESDNQGDVDSESASESEQILSDDNDETKEEEIRESEGKHNNESVKSSSDMENRKSSNKSDDSRHVARGNVQKESKSDQMENHKHREQDNRSKKEEESKHKSSHSKNSSSDSKNKNSESKQKNTDSKHSSSDDKHSKSDSKHSSSDSKNSKLDSKHSKSENKHSSSDSKHSKLDSKHSSSDSKLSSSESKHSKLDSKHSSSDSKHSSSESKNSKSESKHSSSDSKNSKSDSKPSSSDKNHKSLDSKHKSAESKHSSSENKHRSSEKKHDSSESKKISEDKKHKTGNSSEQKSSSSEKKTISEKSGKGSGSEKDTTKNEGPLVKSEMEKSVKNSNNTGVASELNKTLESGDGSDEDPLHWEMLETFEQIKSPTSLQNLSHHEQLNKEVNELSDQTTLTEPNSESEQKNQTVIQDLKKSTVGEKTSGSQVSKDGKAWTEERKHSKDRDRESDHKLSEKASKSHHSEQKDCSTVKDKHHRNESGHKHKHSKHKHKHSEKDLEHKHSNKDREHKHSDKDPEHKHSNKDPEHKHSNKDPEHKHSNKDPEHKHSKRDKSEKRERTEEKKDSKKEAFKTEDLGSKEQAKERSRSSILESLSNEVEEGKFVSEDVPGLWFLNSNNNSFLAGKSDIADSKLEEPCESSKVKFDSHTSDKGQDHTKLPDKSLTWGKDKKEKKKHKHSKDRESSSSKHKSHKDSKSKHDSKHHKDKKRKHSGDADDSKPSKSRRKSSQDGMSFEDLLTAGATETKQSQQSKLSQNDYAKLKSKFKVKKKGDDSSDVSAKKEKGGAGMQIQVTEEDVLGALPQPNTHYRPWRLKEVEKKKTDEELLDEFIAATKSTGRTQMYSGKKQNFVPEVYKLFDMCMTVLCNNIDSLEFVGGVPFAILKPVLEKCTAAQLYRLEDFNPHFLEESDPLWMNHCHKEFRLSKPDEMESWREHYLRKFDEREEKLKKISANINASMAKKVPERTTQLAYIDSAAKPPRNVRRQQARYGTAGPSSGERSRARFLPSMDPIPIGRSGSKAVKSSAPMMAKTLTMIKKMRR